MSDKTFKDIWCNLLIEKKGKWDFAVIGDDGQKIEFAKMKKSTGNQFVVLKLNE